MRHARYGLLPVVLLLAGCMTTDPVTRQQKVSNAAQQAATGAAVGALVGALSGMGSGRNVIQSAAFGAAAGGAAGLVSGAAADRYEAALLAEFSAAGVKITERGANAVLEVDGGILFERDSNQPAGYAARRLAAIGAILTRYPRHRVDVVGHASSDEPPTLAGSRAATARAILANAGVPFGRVRISGRGSSEPMRSDASEATRAVNRRVEVFLAPTT